MKKIIVVLSGGIDANGQPLVWTRQRLDEAIVQYKKNKCPILVVSGLSLYKKPLFKNEKVYLECDSMADYLTTHKIPKKMIYREPTSADTLGNAYFSFCLHIFPSKIDKIILITSNFHLERAMFAFSWVNSFFPKIEIESIGVSDSGMDQNTLKERIKKEKKSLNILKSQAKKFNKIEHLHEYMFSGHDAYKVRGKAKSLSDGAKKSY